jgi:hypothetical protein
LKRYKEGLKCRKKKKKKSNKEIKGERSKRRDWRRRSNSTKKISVHSDCLVISAQQRKNDVN